MGQNWPKYITCNVTFPKNSQCGPGLPYRRGKLTTAPVAAR